MRRLHKELVDKRARAEHMKNSKNQAGIMRAKRKLEMDGKKEQRAITMVVSNSLINLMLRFPEIFIFLSEDNTLFSRNSVFMFLALLAYASGCLVYFSYFANILTFSSNVFVYYLFS